MNFPFLLCLMSSVSLNCHSLAFCFTHSSHLLHFIGTYFVLSSMHSGIIPLFFFVTVYFLFFIIFGYRHIIPRLSSVLRLLLLLLLLLYILLLLLSCYQNLNPFIAGAGILSIYLIIACVPSVPITPIIS